MRFTVLDAWRGIAALAIALFRFDADGWYFGFGIVRNAYLFVDFFFVLSGFVIAYAYLDRLETRSDGANFVIRRFGRVWPLHVFMLMVFVGMELLKLVAGDGKAFTGIRTPDTIVANIFLVQSLGFYEHLAWNFPSWSISTEFWTYCLFAALCLASRRALPYLAAILVVGGLWVVAANSKHGLEVTADWGIYRCIAGFFAGVLVHALWSATRHRDFGRSATVWEVGVLVLAVAFVSVAGTGPLSFAAPFVFALLVYIFAYEGGAVSRALKAKPFQLLGEWSYSIYMVALFVSMMSYKVLALVSTKLFGPMFKTVMVEGVEKRLLDFAPPGVMDGVAVLYLAGVCFTAYLTYRFVENPGRAFFNKVAESLTKRKAVSVGHPRASS